MKRKIRVTLLIFLLIPVLTLSVQVGARADIDTALTASVIGYSVDVGTQDFYEIDLTTGVATLIGPIPVGIVDLEGLAFEPTTGVLYGVDDTTEKLFVVDPSDGMATEVGDLGVSVIDLGLTVDPHGKMWMATELPGDFYSINKATGAATAIGAMGADVTAIAAAGDGTIYGLKPSTNELVTIDIGTGVATVVGPLGLSITGNAGMDFDANGVLWAIDQGGAIFTINVLTGEALVIRNTAMTSFKSLAIPKPLPPPPPPQPVYEYHFRINPYIDVFHMNLTADGWLKGVVTTASYEVPLLGKFEGGRAYVAWDLPAGGIEMGFVVIATSSAAGSMLRIMDDLTVVGPETVWFTAVASEAVETVEGPTLDNGVALEVDGASLFEFVMKPFDDVVFLDTEFEPWLWGWVEAVGPSYPAPVLGFYNHGRFFYAIDYIDDTGLQELSFVAGSINTRRGAIIRSYSGFIFDDPTPIWLEMP